MKTLSNTHPREISYFFPGLLEMSAEQLEARRKEACAAMDVAEEAGYGAGFPAYEYQANIASLARENQEKGQRP